MGTNSCSIEYGVFISHGIWLMRTRKLRQTAKEADCTFDELPEAIEWQQAGFKWRSLSNKMQPERYRRTQDPDEEQDLGARSINEVGLQRK